MKTQKNAIIPVTWAVLIIGILFIHFRPPVINVPIKKSFIYFPFELGQYKGIERINPENLTAVLGQDDLLSRGYENAAGEKLELYCAYFEHVEKMKGPHAPQLCWVGSGWAFNSLGDIKLKLDTPGNGYAIIKKILAQRDKEKILLLYCYKINEKYSADLAEFRVKAVADSIFKRRNCAFTMQLSSEVMPGENLKEKEKSMEDFSVKVLSLLETEFLP